MPLALVIAVAVADPLKVAVAPVEGAVNVTVAPLTGSLFASFTVACRAVVNAVLTVVLCGAPAVAVTLAAGAVVLVSEKPALAEIPDTLAVTV